MRSALGAVCLAICAILAAGCRNLLSSRTLADGGDQVPWALPEPNGSLSGIEPEDTVARAYEPATRKTFVEPSNKATVQRPEMYTTTRTWRVASGAANVAARDDTQLRKPTIGISDSPVASSQASVGSMATRSVGSPATAVLAASIQSRPKTIASSGMDAAVMAEKRVYAGAPEAATRDEAARMTSARAGTSADTTRAGTDVGASFLRGEQAPAATGVSGAVASLDTAGLNASLAAMPTQEASRPVVGGSEVTVRRLQDRFVPIVMATIDVPLASSAHAEVNVTETRAAFDGAVIYVAADETTQASPGLTFDAMIMPEEWALAEAPSGAESASRPAELVATASARDESISRTVAAGMVRDTAIGRTFPTAIIVGKTATGQKLNLTKIASPPVAYPGQVITFHIRYENTTRFVLEDLLIVDSLSEDFAYVPDSAKSSRPAEITEADNEVGSSKISWRIKGKLAPGDSGTVAFQATVR